MESITLFNSLSNNSLPQHNMKNFLLQCSHFTFTHNFFIMKTNGRDWGGGRGKQANVSENAWRREFSSFSFSTRCYVIRKFSCFSLFLFSYLFHVTVNEHWSTHSVIQIASMHFPPSLPPSIFNVATIISCRTLYEWKCTCVTLGCRYRAKWSGKEDVKVQ